jgi:hypothetical protein
MASAIERPVRVLLTVDTLTRDAMLMSFRSLEPHVPDLLVDLASVGLEGSGIDLGDLIALRASEFLIAFEPTDSCRDLFAAVAARNVDLGGIKVESCHGWPILSPVGCSATMADGAAESIRSTESAVA